MNPNGTEPRERVDRREWAVRHLSTALQTEDVGERDYYVSLARQLLVEAEIPDAARRGGEADTTTERL